MKLSRIALGMAALSLSFAAAQANQSLNTSGFAGTTGGTAVTGTVHSSSYNPASSNILIRDGERFRFGYLSSLGMYIELGDVNDLDDEVEGLIDDIEALDALEEAGNDYSELSAGDRQLVDNLSRHNKRLPEDDTQCDPSALDGENIDVLAACYQGVANNLNIGLLDSLERGGQIRAGGNASVPLMPFLFKGGRDWSVGVNVQGMFQSKGQLLTSPFAVTTNIRTVTKSTSANSAGVFAAGAAAAADLEADLDIGIDQIGKTYTVIDDLDRRYEKAKEDDQEEEFFAEFGLDEGSSDERFIRALETELKTKAGYTDEQLAGLRKMADDIGELEEGTFELEVEADFTTDTSIEAKAAAVSHLSVNYAHNLSHALNLDTSQGILEAGARLNYYQARMHRTFLSLRGASQDEEEFAGARDAADRAGDFFEDGYNQESALGVDLGLLWHAGNYQLGATMYNVNEPSFDYPYLTDMFEDQVYKGGQEKDRDQIAAKNLQNQGKLVLDETVTLTRHTVLEAAYFNDNRTWSVQGYYTLGTATNFVGDEFQNMGISGGYYTQSWLLPGVRAGYNKNLTGTELSIVSAGATLFGIMNFDVAMSMDSSSIDGSDIPRYFAVSLGFEEKF